MRPFSPYLLKQISLLRMVSFTILLPVVLVYLVLAVQHFTLVDGYVYMCVCRFYAYGHLYATGPGLGQSLFGLYSSF